MKAGSEGTKKRVDKKRQKRSSMFENVRYIGWVSENLQKMYVEYAHGNLYGWVAMVSDKVVMSSLIAGYTVYSSAAVEKAFRDTLIQTAKSIVKNSLVTSHAIENSSTYITTPASSEIIDQGHYSSYPECLCKKSFAKFFAKLAKWTVNRSVKTLSSCWLHPSFHSTHPVLVFILI